ncbi:HYC_CC_PP family protein [Tenacibaculum sp. E3R01]|uniref:HYC_CC_PP family protein n=1 Tax=Tenacibaculum sp. E3R01 TaxID=2267227 RepID=UPI001F16493A|nr:hypothetical protein [Tenacibaculum sp. E3R01]
MKNVVNKITSILMTFVVVFSTMSFTISSHFCGEELVDISFFKKAASCGMEKGEKSVPDVCTMSTKNCCSDVIQLIDGQDDLKLSSFDTLSLEQHFFIASFYYSYINLFEELHDKVIPFKNYSPPLVVKDIHVLDEVYLI